MTTDSSQVNSDPLISALICTFNRASLLRKALGALCGQTFPSSSYEVVIIDDGSTDETRQVVESFRDILPLRYAYQENSGLSAAKNHAVSLANGPIVVFLDDDDITDDSFLEQHLLSHREYPATNYAVLGRTGLSPLVALSPLMHYVTEVGCNLFSYSNICHGDILDFTYFWGGRSSCKKKFLMEHGVFNPIFRFGAEDIELGFRLSRFEFRVVYNKYAVSNMVRALDFDGFCQRSYRQGRSNWVFSMLHTDPVVQTWALVDGVEEEWQLIEPYYQNILKMGRDLDRCAQHRARGGLPLDALTTRLLHRAYHAAFRAARIKGSVDAKAER